MLACLMLSDAYSSMLFNACRSMQSDDYTSMPAVRRPIIRGTMQRLFSLCVFPIEPIEFVC